MPVNESYGKEIERRTKELEKRPIKLKGKKNAVGEGLQEQQLAQNQLQVLQNERRNNLLAQKTEANAQDQANQLVNQAVALGVSNSTASTLGKYGLKSTGPTVKGQHTQSRDVKITPSKITIVNNNNTTTNTTNKIDGGGGGGDNSGTASKFKTWLSKVNAQQQEASAKRDRDYARREGSLTRAANKMLRRIETVGKSVSEAWNPSTFGQTLGSQLKTFLLIFGMRFLSVYWKEVIKGIDWVVKATQSTISWLGFGEKGEEMRRSGKGLVPTIIGLFGGDPRREKTITEALKNTLNAAFDYFSMKLDHMFERRAEAMGKVKFQMPSGSGLGSDIAKWIYGAVSPLMSSATKYLGDIFTALVNPDKAMRNTVANEVHKVGDQGSKAAQERDKKEHSEDALYASRNNAPFSRGYKKTNVGDLAAFETVNGSRRYSLLSNALVGDRLSDSKAGQVSQSMDILGVFRDARSTGKVDAARLITGLERLQDKAQSSGTVAVDPEFISAFFDSRTTSRLINADHIKPKKYKLVYEKKSDMQVGQEKESVIMGAAGEVVKGGIDHLKKLPYALIPGVGPAVLTYSTLKNNPLSRGAYGAGKAIVHNAGVGDYVLRLVPMSDPRNGVKTVQLYEIDEEAVRAIANQYGASEFDASNMDLMKKLDAAIRAKTHARGSSTYSYTKGQAQMQSYSNLVRRQETQERNSEWSQRTSRSWQTATGIYDDIVGAGSNVWESAKDFVRPGGGVGQVRVPPPGGGSNFRSQTTNDVYQYRSGTTPTSQSGYSSGGAYSTPSAPGGASSFRSTTTSDTYNNASGSGGRSAYAGARMWGNPLTPTRTDLTYNTEIAAKECLRLSTLAIYTKTGTSGVENPQPWQTKSSTQSTGGSAGHVRRAIAKALGLDSLVGHPEPAKDYVHYLHKFGFKPIPWEQYTPQKGDICVNGPIPKHPFGHISLNCGSCWCSDFQQKDMWGGPAFKKNRYATILRHIRCSTNDVQDPNVNGSFVPASLNMQGTLDLDKDGLADAYRDSTGNVYRRNSDGSVGDLLGKSTPGGSMNFSGNNSVGNNYQSPSSPSYNTPSPYISPLGGNNSGYQAPSSPSPYYSSSSSGSTPTYSGSSSSGKGVSSKSDFSSLVTNPLMKRVLSDCGHLDSNKLGRNYTLTRTYNHCCTSGPTTWYKKAGIRLRWWRSAKTATVEEMKRNLQAAGMVAVWHGTGQEANAQLNSSAMLRPGDVASMISSNSAHGVMWTGEDWRSDALQGSRPYPYSSRGRGGDWTFILWRHPALQEPNLAVTGGGFAGGTENYAMGGYSGSYSGGIQTPSMGFSGGSYSAPGGSMSYSSSGGYSSTPSYGSGGSYSVTPLGGGSSGGYYSGGGSSYSAPGGAMYYSTAGSIPTGGGQVSFSGGSWPNCVNAMGKWFEANIHEYRQGGGYPCPLIGGARVRPDCTGFVMACMKMAGVPFGGGSGPECHIGLLNLVYRSPNHIRSQNIRKYFDVLPYNKGALQPYDVMSGDGHGEIYAGNGRSWSWGSCHDGRNGHQGMPAKTAWSAYRVILRWRGGAAGGSSYGGYDFSSGGSYSAPGGSMSFSGGSGGYSGGGSYSGGGYGGGGYYSGGGSGYVPAAPGGSMGFAPTGMMGMPVGGGGINWRSERPQETRIGTSADKNYTNQNAMAMINFLRSKGLPLHAAIGVAGSIMGETAYNPYHSGWDVNGPSGGIAAWHDRAGTHGNFSRLKEFAQARGKPWTDIGTQAEFLWYSLTEGSYKNRNIIEKLRNAKSIEEASYIWGHDYEVFSGYNDWNSKSHQRRMQYGRDLAQLYQQNNEYGYNSAPQGGIPGGGMMFVPGGGNGLKPGFNLNYGNALMVGDSWGVGMKKYFTQNTAVGSTGLFSRNGRPDLPSVTDQINAANYSNGVIIVHSGGNDIALRAKSGGQAAVREDVQRAVAAAQARGNKVIFVAAPWMNHKSASITGNRDKYNEWLKDAALSSGAGFIDTNPIMDYMKQHQPRFGQFHLNDYSGYAQFILQEAQKLVSGTGGQMMPAGGQMQAMMPGGAMGFSATPTTGGGGGDINWNDPRVQQALQQARAHTGGYENSDRGRMEFVRDFYLIWRSKGLNDWQAKTLIAQDGGKESIWGSSNVARRQNNFSGIRARSYGSGRNKRFIWQTYANNDAYADYKIKLLNKNFTGALQQSTPEGMIHYIQGGSPTKLWWCPSGWGNGIYGNADKYGPKILNKLLPDVSNWVNSDPTLLSYLGGSPGQIPTAQSSTVYGGSGGYYDPNQPVSYTEMSLLPQVSQLLSPANTQVKKALTQEQIFKQRRKELAAERRKLEQDKLKLKKEWASREQLELEREKKQLEDKKDRLKSELEDLYSKERRAQEEQDWNRYNQLRTMEDNVLERQQQLQQQEYELNEKIDQAKRIDYDNRTDDIDKREEKLEKKESELAKKERALLEEEQAAQKKKITDKLDKLKQDEKEVVESAQKKEFFSWDEGGVEAKIKKMGDKKAAMQFYGQNKDLQRQYETIGGFDNWYSGVWSKLSRKDKVKYITEHEADDIFNATNYNYGISDENHLNIILDKYGINGGMVATAAGEWNKYLRNAVSEDVGDSNLGMFLWDYNHTYDTPISVNSDGFFGEGIHNNIVPLATTFENIFDSYNQVKTGVDSEGEEVWRSNALSDYLRRAVVRDENGNVVKDENGLAKRLYSDEWINQASSKTGWREIYSKMTPTQRQDFIDHLQMQDEWKKHFVTASRDQERITNLSQVLKNQDAFFDLNNFVAQHGLGDWVGSERKAFKEFLKTGDEKHLESLGPGALAALAQVPGGIEGIKDSVKRARNQYNALNQFTSMYGLDPLFLTEDFDKEDALLDPHLLNTQGKLWHAARVGDIDAAGKILDEGLEAYADQWQDILGHDNLLSGRNVDYWDYSLTDGSSIEDWFEDASNFYREVEDGWQPEVEGPGRFTPAEQMKRMMLAAMFAGEENEPLFNQMDELIDKVQKTKDVLNSPIEGDWVDENSTGITGNVGRWFNSVNPFISVEDRLKIRQNRRLRETERGSGKWEFVWTDEDGDNHVIDLDRMGSGLDDMKGQGYADPMVERRDYRGNFFSRWYHSLFDDRPIGEEWVDYDQMKEDSMITRQLREYVDAWKEQQANAFDLMSVQNQIMNSTNDFETINPWDDATTILAKQKRNKERAGLNQEIAKTQTELNHFEEYVESQKVRDKEFGDYFLDQYGDDANAMKLYMDTEGEESKKDRRVNLLEALREKKKLDGYTDGEIDEMTLIANALYTGNYDSIQDGKKQELIRNLTGNRETTLGQLRTKLAKDEGFESGKFNYSEYEQMKIAEDEDEWEDLSEDERKLKYEKYLKEQTDKLSKDADAEMGLKMKRLVSGLADGTLTALEARAVLDNYGIDSSIISDKQLKNAKQGEDLLRRVFDEESQEWKYVGVDGQELMKEDVDPVTGKRIMRKWTADEYSQQANRIAAVTNSGGFDYYQKGETTYKMIPTPSGGTVYEKDGKFFKMDNGQLVALNNTQAQAEMELTDEQVNTAAGRMKESDYNTNILDANGNVDKQAQNILQAANENLGKSLGVRQAEQWVAQAEAEGRSYGGYRLGEEYIQRDKDGNIVYDDDGNPKKAKTKIDVQSEKLDLTEGVSQEEALNNLVDAIAKKIDMTEDMMTEEQKDWIKQQGKEKGEAVVGKMTLPDGSTALGAFENGHLKDVMYDKNSLQKYMEQNVQRARQQGFDSEDAQRYAENQKRIDRQMMETQHKLQSGEITELGAVIQSLDAINATCQAIEAGMDSIQINVPYPGEGGGNGGGNGGGGGGGSWWPFG